MGVDFPGFVITDRNESGARGVTQNLPAGVDSVVCGGDLRFLGLRQTRGETGRDNDGMFHRTVLWKNAAASVPSWWRTASSV